MKHVFSLTIVLSFSVWSVVAQCAYTELTLTTTTLQWGEEMSWELYQVADNGDELIASHQAEMDSTESVDVVCLEDGCYYFLLLDSWGDGWNGGTLSSDPVIPGFVQDVTLYAGEYGYHDFELGETGCEVVIEGCGDYDAVNYIQEKKA